MSRSNSVLPDPPSISIRGFGDGRPDVGPDWPRHPLRRAQRPGGPHQEARCAAGRRARGEPLAA